MIGRIQYTLGAGDPATPMRSPWHAPVFYDNAFLPYADTLNTGDVQDILLDWYYTDLDPTRHDARFESITPSGFAEVVSHGSRYGHNFKLDFIARVRQTGFADDYAVMQALNDHMSSGSALWWPDFAGFPDESVNVVSSKIRAPKRMKKLETFSFTFNLDELPAGQAPTTIPAFT